jgi:uncharacterized membrane protein
MEVYRLDAIAKTLARATPRRTIVGTLLGAFVVSRSQPRRVFASTGGCYGTTCGCSFGYTCCLDDCNSAITVPMIPELKALHGCFDLRNDPTHCGGCDVRCGVGEACISSNEILQKSGVCQSNAASIAPSVAPVSARYTVTDLGTGTGNAGTGSEISADGDVAGVQEQIANDQVIDSRFRLVLWRNGTTIDLSALGFSAIQSFDDAGDLIGLRGNEEIRYHVRDGTIDPAPDAALPTIRPPAGFVRSWVTARNDRGEAAGTLFLHADDNVGAHGFVATGDGVIALDPTPDGDTSEVSDLNDEGLVVGGPSRDQSGALRAGHAFRYDLTATTMTDLAPVPGYARAFAYAINNPGDAVGFSVNPTDASQRPERACLWRADATDAVALDDVLLADAEWRLLGAHDINDAGEIVGFGLVGNEPYFHPFVLRPIT